tara:strand:+ start:83 stop:439 length:357 start_codon:yes stop_codon:yes gene_type:complete
LDWRLAVDLSEIALGKSLYDHRWMDRSEALAAPVVNTLSDDGVILKAYDGCYGIVNPQSNKLALLFHPLWSTDKNFLTDDQAQMYLDGVESVGEGNVRLCSLWELARFPHLIINWLME